MIYHSIRSVRHFVPRLLFIFIVASGFVWFGIQRVSAPKESGDELYRVVRVVDGDTIDVEIMGKQESVRLIGIDAPESQYSYEPEECYGTEATQYVRALLSEREVHLVSDNTQTDRDSYGRLLRYVWRDDGIFVNEQVIAEGYAREYTFKKKYQYQEQFRVSQADAQDGNKGLWGAGCI
jgi:micrococcal nuclease